MKKSEIVQANIRVHEALLLAGEYEKSPHRSDEAKTRIKNILNSIIIEGQKSPVHADIGCGDGLIFECAPKNWISIGVDAAPKMLAACKEKHPKVEVIESTAEFLPIDDNKLDILTCYSFLDHLEDRTAFYREAFRVLKPTGICYFGLSPNRLFAEALATSTDMPFPSAFTFKQIELERTKAISNDLHYISRYGLNGNDLLMAEPGKTFLGGMSPAEEKRSMELAGFTSVEIKYHWIMCQHEIADTFISSIEQGLPITASCFKYFDIYAKKA